MTMSILRDGVLVELTDAEAAAMFPPPPTVPPPVPITISDRQFFQQLAIMGKITQAEALAAVGTGAIPPEMQSVLNAMPADQQFSAEMILTGARDFLRTDPLVAVYAQSQGMSDDDINALWLAASAL
jgi:hypothetical protein